MHRSQRVAQEFLRIEFVFLAVIVVMAPCHDVIVASSRAFGQDLAGTWFLLAFFLQFGVSACANLTVSLCMASVTVSVSTSAVPANYVTMFHFEKLCFVNRAFVVNIREQHRSSIERDPIRTSPIERIQSHKTKQKTTRSTVLQTKNDTNYYYHEGDGVDL